MAFFKITRNYFFSLEMRYFAFFEKFEPWKFLLHIHTNPMCNMTVLMLKFNILSDFTKMSNSRIRNFVFCHLECVIFCNAFCNVKCYIKNVILEICFEFNVYKIRMESQSSQHGRRINCINWNVQAIFMLHL